MPSSSGHPSQRPSKLPPLTPSSSPSSIPTKGPRDAPTISYYPSQRPSLRPSKVNPSSISPTLPSLEVTLTFSIEYAVPDVRDTLEAFVENIVSEVVQGQTYNIETSINIFRYGTLKGVKCFMTFLIHDEQTERNNILTFQLINRMLRGSCLQRK